MAWGMRDVSERRLEFVMRASSGQEELKALCEEFEISRPTGYVWLDRYRSCEQLQDLGEKSRRPRQSPKQTPEPIQRRLIELRQQYPEWGARKLVVLLKREGIALPRITAHRMTAGPGFDRLGPLHAAAPGRR